MSRYIDADMLISFWEHEEEQFGGALHPKIEDVIASINFIPAANVREDIKGVWIEHDDGMVLCECSVCHEEFNLYEEHVIDRDFCPNCGANLTEIIEAG